MNSPGNPTGALDDLGAAAAWGRAHGVPVFSDECYVEFTWDGPPRTILEHGLDGVVAVHSLSKRSNLAGLRVGFYAGDAELVALPAGGAQARRACSCPARPRRPAVVALDDDAHVDEQRDRYRRRLERMAHDAVAGGRASTCRCRRAASTCGSTPATAGRSPSGWPREGGALVSPGEFYGAGGRQNVRVAVVQPDDRIDLVAERLGVS